MKRLIRANTTTDGWTKEAGYYHYENENGYANAEWYDNDGDGGYRTYVFPIDGERTFRTIYPLDAAKEWAEMMLS